MTHGAAPFREGYAHANGQRIHYVANGDHGAPLLLFLHGFPEFWLAWRYCLAAFGQTHYAVAVDLPGYNLSDKPAALEAYRARAVSNVVQAFVSALGYERCILVGHDWGGAIGWYLAATRPAVVEGFVAINAVHPTLFARELATNPAQRLASEYISFFCSEGAERKLCADDFAYLRSMFDTGSGRPSWFDEATEAAYKTAWSQKGSLQGGLNYYRASSVSNERSVEQSAVRPSGALTLRPMLVVVPTLVIWGKHDRFLLNGNLDGLQDYVPRVQIEWISDGSHWVVHEQPERIVRLIASFVAEISGTSIN